MYLSRLILNTRVPDIAYQLADIQRTHSWILRCFPPASDEAMKARERHGILYRVEPMQQPDYAVRLLCQSQTLPDWSKIPAAAASSSVRAIAYVYEALQDNQQLHFRLCAAPTRTDEQAPRPDDDRRHRAPRRPILDYTGQVAWLQRKAVQHGFTLLDDVLMRRLPSAYGSRRSDAVTLSPVTFEGTLRITDSTLFSDALRGGIGTGKAYGMGLLSVAQRD